ncbi:MAG: AbrB/MazE/SpoVT family DNA-binding domain-containing protein [Bacteroidetes bacterium]|nr:AbrB/MazE/SpoVT family DNA-binding domain-containing protein [Bacteroidota bacterium]
MDTVKIIKNGGSQAVRLPRLYRMSGKEAYVKKVPEGILLMEKGDIWTSFERCLEDFPADFLNKRRIQKNQKRRGFE